jgi:hypothetical protein
MGRKDVDARHKAGHDAVNKEDLPASLPMGREDVDARHKAGHDAANKEEK